MLCPSNKASPSVRVRGMRSFIRLSVRRNVDLPQPEGPMSAVTCLSRMGIETSKSACLGPYQKLSVRTSILTPAFSSRRVAASFTTRRGTPADDVLKACPSCCPDRLRRVSIKPPCNEMAKALERPPASPTYPLYAISDKRVLLVQRNAGIDNDAVLQHD